MDRRRYIRALTAGAVVALAGAAGWATMRRSRAELAPPAPDPGERHGDPRAAPANDAADADEASSSSVGRVFVANHGKLVGAFNGFAWVVGAEGTRIDDPSPCNEHACFRGTDGLLCARGTFASCDARGDACRRDPWAMKIGFDVRREGGPWGAAARTYVSIEHRGAPHVRLAAHRARDADPSREYCIDDYRSGTFVPASAFRTECWGVGGESLASFAEVDKLALEWPAGQEARSFDLCVTRIQVGD